MNENSVITKTRRRKLCMAASDPEKPLAVITHVAFGSGGVNVSGEPIVPTETQTALNSELARYEDMGHEVQLADSGAMIAMDPNSGLPGRNHSPLYGDHPQGFPGGQGDQRSGAGGQ